MVHIINCSGSIFVAIIDYIRNGVSLTTDQIKGICVGFIGLTFVINANLILYAFGVDGSSASGFDNYRTDNIWVTTAAAILYLLLNVSWAYGIVESKLIQNCNTFQISFHLGLCVLISSGFFYPTMPTQPDPWNVLIGVGTTGIPLTFAQFLFIKAFSLSNQHGRVSIMMFSMVVTSYLVSIFRYHESFNLVAVGGTVLAVYGILKCILDKK